MKPYRYLSWTSARRKLLEMIASISPNPKAVEWVKEFFDQFVTEYGCSYMSDAYEVTRYQGDEKEYVEELKIKRMLHDFAEKVYETGAYTLERRPGSMPGSEALEIRVLVMNFEKYMFRNSDHPDDKKENQNV